MLERVNYAGQHVGNYRLVQLLGKGGFAEVYLGVHIHLNTQVAVKLLHSRLADEDLEDFRHEAQTIAKLMHPNIIRVLDFGVEGDIPYLAMDYAPNGTLRRFHPRGSVLPLSTVIPYVKQAAEALQHAHDQRLIHRDVKPENMLLGRNNEILLSDFGIALTAQSSQYQSTQNVAGTVVYMAPEQIQAHPRPASDQYSLGIVVYEWLSGSRPFQGSFTEIAVKQAMVTPPPLRERLPHLSPAIEEVVMMALAKDPTQRFTNIRAFAQAFEMAAKQSPSSFSTSSLPSTRLEQQFVSPLSPLAPSNTTIAYVLSEPEAPPWRPQSVTNRLASVSPGSSSLLSSYAALPAQSSLQSSEYQDSYAESNPSVPDSPPVQPIETLDDVSVEVERPHQNIMEKSHRFSRRTLVTGVVGLVAASSGLTWLITSHHSAATTPASAIVQMVDTGHPGSVWSVAWSPNGQYIVSGSDDGAAVWYSNTGQRVLAYHNNIASALQNDRARAVAWAPDSTSFVSAFSDGAVQGVDVQSGHELFRYSNAHASLNAVAWSPDGHYIATGDSNNIAVVYDIASGKALTTYTNHTASILALAWSPDSKHVVSGSSDQTARVWDPLTGQTQLFYKKHTGAVQALSWSSDGTHIASGSSDGTVQVWEPMSGHSLFIYREHTGSFITAVAWSHDNKYIASGGNDVNTFVWEARSGKQRLAFVTSAIFSIAWSPDDTQIVTGGQDKLAQVWRLV